MANEPEGSGQLTLGSHVSGYDEPLYIIDDYGPVGDGMMNAHTCLAANGGEYIIKGPSLSPTYKHVGANELVCAKLGKTLGLPILPHDLLQNDEKLFFGSALMRDGEYYKELTSGLFAKCENADISYMMVVFDTWVCNGDRHEENLIARRIGVGTASERLFLLCNDHSNALLHHVRPSGLSSYNMSMVNAVLIDFVRDYLTDAVKLRSAIDRIAQCPRPIIHDVVQSVPRQWLGPREKNQVEDFLVSRQGTLLANARASIRYLPRMEPGLL